jgi:hypothetical protein
MKKVIRKGVLMLGILTTMASYANEVSYASINKETKRTILKLNKVKEGHRLVIKDANGVILYKEYIKDSGAYSKEFDLTELPDGKYVFEIEKDVEINIIPFKVVSSKVTFNKEEESTIYKPVVFKRGDLVYISRSNFTELPLEYKIYYAYNDDLIASENFKHDEPVKKVYNFSNARKGIYTVVFRTGGRVFVQKVKV